MIYSGTEFCVQDANKFGGWSYVDFSLGVHTNDPPIVVEGTVLG